MSELARRYAEALYGLFPDEARLRAAAAALQDSPELREALLSPAVCPETKARILARLPAVSDPPVLLNFFALLTKKGRMALLPDILREFHTLDLRAKNAAECVMTCVRPPDAERREQIKAALCRLHNKSEVRLVIRTDPELLGGFVLNIEGVTYDRSIRGELLALSRHLEEVNAP